MNIVTMIRIEDNKSFQGFIYQDQYTRRFVFNYFNDETNKWETNVIEKFKPNNGKNEYVVNNDPFSVYYSPIEVSDNVNDGIIISSQPDMLSPDQMN